MEFRWIALISLWTILSGPILARPSAPPRFQPRPEVATSSPVKTTASLGAERR
jgi:hypothetical protein